ncbi:MULTISPECIES: M20 family metallopeptidase [unclassified Microbacterium]|uniref:M20 metallopeptidase family protein n=1 Tax=unclassified Microbacterium TaxID=2609290 RepID=UPI00214CB90F|nr:MULTISPECIES: M20 family metallopeptidase [unclassified Microbacterium]MCR2810637.1 M20 family metallopeptidase [Microbacterium sp. zg.B185]WIM18174.1 M20 family metallopeptidase [Microbacterium sp. zg-B185]
MTDLRAARRSATSDTTGDLVALRRALHRIPEVGLDLPVTQAALEAELDGLPVRIVRGASLSSLAVIIDGALPGPSVLLRSDMDALPVIEHSGAGFASSNGAMHACGHDLHMSALVGAIRLLCARREDVRGQVIAIFQPGEEGHGGAAAMIDEGVLEITGATPIASYGIHVFSFLPTGVFTTKPGILMGGTVNLDIEVFGSGGHAARPHAASNPILAGALIVQAIQSHIAQRTRADSPLIATVGAFQAGTAANVIPDSATVRVSLRATTVPALRELQSSLEALAESTATALGMHVSVTPGPDMYPTVNSASDAVLVRSIVTELFGPDRYEDLVHPEMISEDFSNFLDLTGGAFVFVGAQDAAASLPPETNHSARALFDDGVLVDAAELLAELAIRRLRIESDAR